MAMLFLARSRAFRGLVLGTRVQLYCELDLAKRDVRRRSLRVLRAHGVFKLEPLPAESFVDLCVQIRSSRRRTACLHARLLSLALLASVRYLLEFPKLEQKAFFAQLSRLIAHSEH